MSLYPKSANLLIEQLAKLPGVGKATAQRLAFFILKSDQKENIALANAIKEIKENIRFCFECGIMSGSEICNICTDQNRDSNIICLVEEPLIPSLSSSGAIVMPLDEPCTIKAE